MKTILILGGYGNFGKRIAKGLSTNLEYDILIAGRSGDKARALIVELERQSSAGLSPVVLDINAADFAARLAALAPDVVVHTSGPFQGQAHRVPMACIEAAAHYVDLADDRRFVCDITALDATARERGVLLVSGASTVPGLSSTVIDAFKDRFAAIDSIDVAIAPGNKAERGQATIEGILSYTGHRFRIFTGGQWRDVRGWMDSQTKDFGGLLGRRPLANVDVPDLELFPERYAVRDSVRFQAGLELPLLHYTMVAMANLVKIGLANNWAPLLKPITYISRLFERFGTDAGGMQIRIVGENSHHQRNAVTWTLYAPDGIGPYVPTISAVIVAKKMLSGRLSARGAMPCLGLYGLDEFETYIKPLGVYCETVIDG